MSPESAKGIVLASVDGRPAWTMIESGNGSIQSVGVNLPVLGPRESFRQHFLISKWFRLLPLFHFLRSETKSIGWRRSEPQACFIIDDPNLHATRYGYVDFEALVQHARSHGYHAAIATVPLDTWHVNRKAASVFRENAEHISILIHGINHTKNELASSDDPSEMQRQLAIGLERIDDFERRSGISVCKVMVPPHGALSVAVANTMGTLAYEAGCVSYGSLLHWNPNAKWAPDFGFAPGQFLGPSGFPVVHRVTLDEVDVRLCAFLDHPIVITSHHYDLSSGMEKFQNLSRIINSFGPISWTNLRVISRSNYLTSKQGKTLQVRPYTKKINLSIPNDVSQLCFSLPWTSRTISLERRGEGMFCNPEPDERVRVEFREIESGCLEVSFAQSVSHLARTVGSDKPAIWPVVRRVLTESRDRLRSRLKVGN
jgi:hypothetical protein